MKISRTTTILVLLLIGGAIWLGNQPELLGKLEIPKPARRRLPVVPTTAEAAIAAAKRSVAAGARRHGYESIQFLTAAAQETRPTLWQVTGTALVTSTATGQAQRRIRWQSQQLWDGEGQQWLSGTYQTRYD